MDLGLSGGSGSHGWIGPPDAAVFQETGLALVEGCGCRHSYPESRLLGGTRSRNSDRELLSQGNEIPDPGFCDLVPLFSNQLLLGENVFQQAIIPFWIFHRSTSKGGGDYQAGAHIQALQESRIPRICKEFLGFLFDSLSPCKGQSLGIESCAGLLIVAHHRRLIQTTSPSVNRGGIAESRLLVPFHSRIPAAG